MTTPDTDPTNPVDDYPADVFPIGAALTVAYGGTERMFCTLGNLYRIMGHLTGEVPSVDADPNAVPPIPSLSMEIDRCREHVAAQLPDTLRAIDPPPAHADDTAILAYLGGITNRYGTTIRLDALPTDDTEGTDTHA